MRLGGHFLSLETVAWGLAIAFLFGNIDGARSATPAFGIPPISIGPIALVDSRAIYYLIWAIVVAVLLLCYNLLDSRIGRAMRALRGGNTLVESVGHQRVPHQAGDVRHRRVPRRAVRLALCALEPFRQPGAVRRAGMGIEYLLMAMVGGSGSFWAAWSARRIVTLLKNRCRTICR